MLRKSLTIGNGLESALVTMSLQSGGSSALEGIELAIRDHFLLLQFIAVTSFPLALLSQLRLQLRTN